MGKIVAHDFKKKHFNRPTWCNFCQKFVWGIGYQGFQCIVCKIACHPKCCALIEPNCHVRSSTASTTPSYNPDRYPDIPEFKLPSHPLPTPPSHRQSAPPVPQMNNNNNEYTSQLPQANIKPSSPPPIYIYVPPEVQQRENAQNEQKNDHKNENSHQHNEIIEKNEEKDEKEVKNNENNDKNDQKNVNNKEERKKEVETRKRKFTERKNDIGRSLFRITAHKQEELAAKRVEDIYDIIDELGSGAFATVMRARHKEEGKEYAIKIIHKKKTKNEIDRIAAEMEILQSVDHPNVIHLKELFELDNKLYIVTDLARGGELFDRIVQKKSYTEREASLLIRNLLNALIYLHKKGIVHRDLKPENILLRTKEDDVDIVIADFGLSKFLGENMMIQSACGTPIYVAPEVLSGKPYTKAVDMWTVGVITFILLSGKPPFYHRHMPMLFESIMNADFDYPPQDWDNISDDAIAFIDSLLVVKADDRLDAEQALNHKWIQNCKKDVHLPQLSNNITNFRGTLKMTLSSATSYRDLKDINNNHSSDDSSDDDNDDDSDDDKSEY